MFLPTTKEEIKLLKWDRPDIILVSGDTYIDSPFIGVAVIGNYLIYQGFKVAVIAQPDIKTDEITRLGEPKLFWGISAGAMDSFVANYTALNKFRNNDDLTPGGINNKRPDRACMVYTNLIRRYFKNTKPIILGGVEASLRRIVHYDYKDNALRRSILFDSKADIIVYGMGEKSTLELAKCFKNGTSYENIEGICYISKNKPEDSLEIPSFEECIENSDKFFESFSTFYKNSCSKNEKILTQKHNDRYLICNPKQDTLSQEELDQIYNLNYTRQVHPYYQKLGHVKAQETIKFSITTHRGCFGECNFCAISIHQGKKVISRSKESIINETQKITNLKDFKGYITDLGGPTANMFNSKCLANKIAGTCENKRCLYPSTCKNLDAGHDSQIELLKELALLPNIKKIFISSGIRYDMVCSDKLFGEKYLNFIVNNNVSGQMKIAPEHCDDNILALMGKPNSQILKDFIEMFKRINSSKIFLTYYFIAAYPGCSDKEMKSLKNFIDKNLKIHPEQVQIFTPTPSTNATLMYYSQKDLLKNKIFVQKDRNAKQKQKRIVCL
ncbi:MAG: YgiQ family radical SAM protein [Endomicrobium sp.]|jgi:uncharacterized radical SAM protein YgiQ|nr:YgiQ family radical SAM protein [Endomicrobium sp.]